MVTFLSSLLGGPAPISDEYQPAVSRTRAQSKRFAHVVDRKSTRLNSSHSSISYAVFCLKKNMTRIAEFTKVRVSQSGGDLNYWVVRLTDDQLFECPKIGRAHV